MYTKFGEFVRILRIKRHEVMGDMAVKLGTSVTFLSAVENGKKNVPADWIDRISETYCLNKDEKWELEEAIEESRTQYKISMNNAGATKRHVAMQFARSFDNMDDETALKILKLLNEKGGNDGLSN